MGHTGERPKPPTNSPPPVRGQGASAAPPTRGPAGRRGWRRGPGGGARRAKCAGGRPRQRAQGAPAAQTGPPPCDPRVGRVLRPGRPPRPRFSLGDGQDLALAARRPAPGSRLKESRGLPPDRHPCMGPRRPRGSRRRYAPAAAQRAGRGVRGVRELRRRAGHRGPGRVPLYLKRTARTPAGLAAPCGQRGGARGPSRPQGKGPPRCAGAWRDESSTPLRWAGAGPEPRPRGALGDGGGGTSGGARQWDRCRRRGGGTPGGALPRALAGHGAVRGWGGRAWPMARAGVGRCGWRPMPGIRGRDGAWREDARPRGAQRPQGSARWGPGPSPARWRTPPHEGFARRRPRGPRTAGAADNPAARWGPRRPGPPRFGASVRRPGRCAGSARRRPIGGHSTGQRPTVARRRAQPPRPIRGSTCLRVLPGSDRARTLPSGSGKYRCGRTARGRAAARLRTCVPNERNSGGKAPPLDAGPAARCGARCAPTEPVRGRRGGRAATAPPWPSGPRDRSPDERGEGPPPPGCPRRVEAPRRLGTPPAHHAPPGPVLMQNPGGSRMDRRRRGPRHGVPGARTAFLRGRRHGARHLIGRRFTAWLHGAGARPSATPYLPGVRGSESGPQRSSAPQNPRGLGAGPAARRPRRAVPRAAGPLAASAAGRVPAGSAARFPQRHVVRRWADAGVRSRHVGTPRGVGGGAAPAVPAAGPARPRSGPRRSAARVGGTLGVCCFSVTRWGGIGGAARAALRRGEGGSGPGAPCRGGWPRAPPAFPRGPPPVFAGLLPLPLLGSAAGAPLRVAPAGWWGAAPGCPPPLRAAPRGRGTAGPCGTRRLSGAARSPASPPGEGMPRPRAAGSRLSGSLPYRPGTRCCSRRRNPRGVLRLGAATGC